MTHLCIRQFFMTSCFFQVQWRRTSFASVLDVIGVWASFSVNWFRPVSAEPCWPGHRPGSLHVVTRPAGVLRVCFPSVWDWLWSSAHYVSDPNWAEKIAHFFSWPKMILLLQLRILFLTWIHACQLFLALATRGLFSFYRVFNTFSIWHCSSAQLLIKVNFYFLAISERFQRGENDN